MRSLVFGGEGIMGPRLGEALVGRVDIGRVFDRPSTVSPGTFEIESKVEWRKETSRASPRRPRPWRGVRSAFISFLQYFRKSSNLDPVFDIETNLTATVQLLNNSPRDGSRS
jgi:UDP-glucose 4-epimerase